MNFQDAISTGLKKYADFGGRASRPEYWWFALFVFAVHLVITMVGSFLGMIALVGLFVPSIAVAARRLHDVNRSGWWQLLWLVPLLGWGVLIYFLVQEGDAQENQYGAVASHLISSEVG